MMPLNELFTRYSTWVAAFLAAAATYWLGLSPDEQKAMLVTYPILAKLTPLAGFVVFLVARAKLQPPKEPDA